MTLIDAFKKIHPATKETQRCIEDLIIHTNYPKGHQLLEIGQIDRYLHFVVKGSGRVFYYQKGRDVTDYIALDGQFLGGVSSVFSGLPSHKGIEIVEDSVVQSVPAKAMEDYAKRYHDMETLYRKMMTWAFLECQSRIEDIRFLSAAERYQALEKKYPGVSNRIPLKHLASYLGTTQVSLSRIRAGIQ